MRYYKTRIRRSQPSGRRLQRIMPRFNKRVLVRMGRRDESKPCDILINPPEAIAISCDKLAMKNRFMINGVDTTNFEQITEETIRKAESGETTPPMVIKGRFSSGGKDVWRPETKERLVERLKEYVGSGIVEPFFKANREFRVHADTTFGSFFIIEKVQRNADKDRWKKGRRFCSFVEDFDLSLYGRTLISLATVNALKAVGLDIGCCDVMMGENESYIKVCETNSAPGLGEKTILSYREAIIRLVESRGARME